MPLGETITSEILGFFFICKVEITGVHFSTLACCRDKKNDNAHEISFEES